MTVPLVTVGTPRLLTKGQVLVDVRLGEDRKHFGDVPLFRVGDAWEPGFAFFDTCEQPLTAELFREIRVRLREFAFLHDATLQGIAASAPPA